ncbi:hemolysin [Ephemerocybe angulata]|uniref:Hemolysin n=1 Tax=Ephemerocybe angulata TaxID=980116 RepID=A0A8H6I542_9AGAR|nr:hemolysin [Tulosesus angulatus]
MFISALLVLAGGICAGLTLGLMGLDDLHLRVLAASSENPHEKRNAQTVLNLLHGRRHWVLVVLLLSNVVVNESLPIFLDNALGGGLPRSSSQQLQSSYSGERSLGKNLYSRNYLTSFPTRCPSFREIIPQALSVRYGLSIGAACAPLVIGLMYIMAPVAYPISWLLDFALGAHERHTYKKAELKSLLQFHSTGAEPLRDDEISILNGVLELGSKRIETVMTPLEHAMLLSADTILDQATFNAIIQSGYSRFPVHLPGRPKAFIGLLLVKRLLGYDPKQALPVSAFPLSILPEAHTSINCFQALDYFQTGRAHLLLISRTPGKEVEMITEEIIDETDRYSDNQSKMTVSRTNSELNLNNIVERGTHASFDESSPLLRYSSNGEVAKPVSYATL